jgi:hypothetical protein
MKTTANRFIRAFFWFAFASFLAASIPHVAYFFRAFEPSARGNLDYLYWGVAGAIAVSIDVMVFLLSVTVAEMQRGKANTAAILTVWLFILLLSGLSWFINWQYAEQFASSMLNRVVGETIGPFNVGAIDPIIASIFQVFILSYTYVADKIANDKPKSAAELKQEVDEEEEREQHQARLDALRQKKRERRITGLVESAQIFSQRVFNPSRPAMQTEPETELHERRALPEKLEQALQFFQENPQLLSDTSGEVDTQLAAYLSLRRPASARVWRLKAVEILGKAADDEMNVTRIDDGKSADESRMDEGQVVDGQAGELRMLHGKITDAMGQDSEPSLDKQTDGKSISNRPTGPRYITYLEASKRTGYAIDTLKRMAKKGVIRRSPYDENMVVASSLKGIQKRQKAAEQPREGVHVEMVSGVG